MVRFADDHLQPVRHGLVLCVADGQQRLRPALDGGQRGAQLVGDGGDKVVFHLGGLVDLRRHIVDGFRQLRQLVVPVGQLHPLGEVAGGDVAGGVVEPLDGPHDGPHEEHAGDQHQYDGEQTDDGGDDGQLDDLPVHQLQRDDVAHRPVAGAVGQRQKRRHSHHLFAGGHLPRPEGAPGGQRQRLFVLRSRPGLGDEPGGGDDHLAVFVQHPHLRHVDIGEILHVFVGAGGKDIVGSADIGAEEIRHGGALPQLLEPALHGVVVVVFQQYDDARIDQQQNDRDH